MRRFLPLFLILLLTAIFRLWNLSNYPAGFTPDEASFGYDAYSILKTGHDQWGESFPLTFRSFGDFKAPLYVYALVPRVAVLGLSEFAVRLPSALAGILAVLVVYLLAGQLFKDRRISIFSAFLLAVSPWHISLSRGAFEANLTTLLMPLGVYTFLRGLNSKKWMFLSAFVLV